MRSLTKAWRADTGLFLGLWLTLMVVGQTQLFRDPGTFWHTVMGRRMLASRHFIDADPFSFTFGGHPWVPFEWLAECAMAVIHRISGLDGLLLATATTLAALYSWIGHRLIRSGLHWLPTTLVVAAIIAASSTSFHVRPHVASFLFFAITYAFLTDFEAGRIGLRRLFWLVPLFVVWTNWHGAVLGGFATLVLAGLGWCFSWSIGRESPIHQPRQALWLWLLVLASGLTALVNPYGIQLPIPWLEIMRSPVVPRLIMEHAPPSPRKPEFWAIVILALVYGLALLTTMPRWPRITWLIPFVWFALALSRVRHSPLFAIAAGVALAEMLPHTRLATFLARPGRDLFRFAVPAHRTWAQRDWRPLVLPVVVVLSSLMLQVSNVRIPVFGRGWAGLDSTIWPVELLPELRQANQDHPQGARVFNDYLFGGFLIDQTPNLKVFIDDRCEVYGDDWLLQFDRAATTEPTLMDGWLERYRIDYVLVHTGSVFDRQVSRKPGWSLLGRCRVATFYGRVPLDQTRRPANPATIADRGT